MSDIYGNYCYSLVLGKVSIESGISATNLHSGNLSLDESKNKHNEE